MKRRFNRFELKYVIHVDLAKRIRDELATNMAEDHYGTGGVYRVTSLYYDSPDYACFRSKVEGIKYRRKVRVRTYGRYADDGMPVALEIKQRINRTVQKRRVWVPLDVAENLLHEHEIPPMTDTQDVEVVQEIDLLAHSLQLQPACVISYLRDAWVGSRYEPGLRITFDRELTARSPRFGLGEGAPDVHFMSPPEVIMEVKADEAVPLWVSRMLTRHQCTLRRVSKYCLGLATLQKRGNEWTSC